MPDALTRGRQRPGQPAGTVAFPAVPNRWLVRRGATANLRARAWVVESDYLHPDGTGDTAGVAVPFPPAPAQNRHRPFRYLGRAVPIAALLDGALSIGRVTPADRRTDATLAADLISLATLAPWTRQVLSPSGGTSPSGFLLRSHVVAGWPDLRITAQDAHGNTLDPLRPEPLSPGTLLCVFAGDLATLTLAQPEHTLHFGLGTAAGTWRDGTRVVNVTALAGDRIGAPAAGQAASARFAANMIATAPKVTVTRR